MSPFFHSLRILLGASALATALGVAPLAAAQAASADDPATAVAADSQATSAEDLASRRDLAEAVVAVSHMDDVLFGCIANQQLGVADVQHERFAPELQAAFVKVQPEIRELIVDTWVEYDADELRSWLHFFSSPEGQRIARKMSSINTHMNHDFFVHLGPILAEIKKAEQDAKAGGTPTGHAAQGGF